MYVGHRGGSTKPRSKCDSLLHLMSLALHIGKSFTEWHRYRKDMVQRFRFQLIRVPEHWKN